MADKVNLQKSFGLLNERLEKLFDEAGVRRSFTVPFIEGEEAHAHIAAVGLAAQPAGGLGNNLVTTSHHSEGKGWGSGDGQTTGHPTEKLRSTIIPKDDENAKAAIEAAQAHLNNIEKLLGDDSVVLTAKGQLKLVTKTGGAGMSLFDFGVMLIQLMHAPNQAVARAHSGTKDGGHAPHLRGPRQAAPQGETQGAEQAPEDQNAAPEAEEAPEAQEAPPEEALAVQGQ